MAAQQGGFFDREIFPIAKEDGSVVAKDDGPRAGTTLGAFGRSPAGVQGGRDRDGGGEPLPLNDGAAAVLVITSPKAAQLSRDTLTRIVASAVSGNDPEIIGVTPIDGSPGP